MAIKNKIPRGMKNEGNGWGYKDHKRRAKIRVMIGEIIYGEILDVVGLACSLIKSFSASAKG